VQVRDDEMAGTCSTYWRSEMHTVVWLENMKGKYLGVNGRILLAWILRKYV
jgi:hypothetical protein